MCCAFTPVLIASAFCDPLEQTEEGTEPLSWQPRGQACGPTSASSWADWKAALSTETWGMDMRKRVRCMMLECFHQCQPAPSFQAVFTLAQRVITSGTLGGESQRISCPSFSLGSGLQEQTNGGMQVCV